MNEFIDNLIGWFNKAFKPISDFLYTYRDNPLLWISILLIGIFITKIAIDALSKNDGL